MARRPDIFLLVVILVTAVPMLMPVEGEEELVLAATVTDQSTGLPLANANAVLWRRYSISRTQLGWEVAARVSTDESGVFLLGLQASQNYLLYVTCDDPLTPGFDYLPAFRSFSTGPSGRLSMSIQLQPAATIVFDYEPFLVESSDSPQVTYSILDAVSQQTVWDSSHNSYLGLRSNLMFVPIGVSFTAKIQVSVIVEGKSLSCVLTASPSGGMISDRGASIHVDVRAFSVPRNLDAVASKIDEISALVQSKENQGFYLAAEQHRLLKAASLRAEGERLFENQAFEASHVKLRESYIELSDLKNWLNAMYGEAFFSTSFLLLFLAFTAISASYLLFEKNASKNLFTVVIYPLLVGLLYVLYPGSQLLNPEFFTAMSILSLTFAFGAALLTAKLLQGSKASGHTPLRNLIAPVFSIAKRSLGRRKLRTYLTVLSVVVLVSSFIALTSFSSGYGLVLTRLSGAMEANNGVLVRTPTEVITSGLAPVSGGKGVNWYTGLSNSSWTWFSSRSEVVLTAPKCENYPGRQYREAYQPAAYVGRTALWGVMGIVPSAESTILDFASTVAEGRFLKDDDIHCALISEVLSQKLGVEVGQSISLRLSGRTHNLTVVGILEDAKLNDLRDLDGDSPLPMKIVETGRVELDAAPDIITEGFVPCDASEVVITTFNELSGYPEFPLIRLDLLLREEEDLGEYIVKLALMRGFQAWANTDEGVQMANLATYYEGKGLPLLVPWMIVVLTVVVTMLNSLFERRKEIYIFSSIGMNPSHISGIFLAEVTMLGVLAGGGGYLLGLAWYKLMAFFTIALQVRMKVSATWVLGAIGVSLAAVLVGCWTALKTSTVITPSLSRRWYSVSSAGPIHGRQELLLPVILTKKEIDEFEKYLYDAVASHMYDLDNVTAQVKRLQNTQEDSETRMIDFVYRSTHASLGRIYAKNRLVLYQDSERVYRVQLISEGDPQSTVKVGSLVREMILQWSVIRGTRKPE